VEVKNQASRQVSAAARQLGSWVRILAGGVYICVVCCQVKVSATGRSLAQRSRADCGVSFYVIWKPQELDGPGPRWSVARKVVGYEVIRYFYHSLHEEIGIITWFTQ
jgi:hypothetical protein